MKTIKDFNIYFSLSTFIRNILDIYSIVFLYQKGISIKEIICIYAIVYSLGYFISKESIIIGNAIGYKYVLILSSIITSITFYILNISNNIYLLATFISLSSFTYHPIRHYYGIKILKYKQEIAKTLIMVYLASLLSSYVTVINLSFNYLITISLFGIIPSLFLKKEKKELIKYPNKLYKYKVNYFIFDQFKSIFILLEPLYLYLISNTLSYVGTFNAILTISSIICVYYIANKVDIYKHYKYINIAFVIILILKLNIDNQKLLLIIALFEGIGIKTNELVSTINLYQNNHLNLGYIIISEKIFCISKSLILSVIYFLPITLKTNLYILLIGIFILSFQYKKNTFS